MVNAEIIIINFMMPLQLMLNLQRKLSRHLMTWCLDGSSFCRLRTGLFLSYIMRVRRAAMPSTLKSQLQLLFRPTLRAPAAKWRLIRSHATGQHTRKHARVIAGTPSYEYLSILQCTCYIMYQLHLFQCICLYTLHRNIIYSK